MIKKQQWFGARRNKFCDVLIMQEPKHARQALRKIYDCTHPNMAFMFTGRLPPHCIPSKLSVLGYIRLIQGWTGHNLSLSPLVSSSLEAFATPQCANSRKSGCNRDVGILHGSSRRIMYTAIVARLDYLRSLCLVVCEDLVHGHRLVVDLFRDNPSLCVMRPSRIWSEVGDLVVGSRYDYLGAYEATEKAHN